MGGDRGVADVVRGMGMSLEKNPRLRYIVHGDAGLLDRSIRQGSPLAERTEVRHAPGVVAMDEKPSRVLRNAQGTSMLSALEAVKAGESPVVISCGNTGALMALAMLALRKAPGVDRPAIAVLWPSLNATGYNVLLDAGADIRADADDLLKYAVMGASYARNALGLSRPRVGLLNVGTEEHKGRSELHEAAERIAETAPTSDFEYIGYVEGTDMPSDRVDVIVTDGFTGNVALKTGEGTARMIQGLLKEAFAYSILSRIGALFALTSLKRLQKRIDPRRVNGGVFLGLNGTVIKSHGSPTPPASPPRSSSPSSSPSTASTSASPRGSPSARLPTRPTSPAEARPHDPAPRRGPGLRPLPARPRGGERRVRRHAGNLGRLDPQPHRHRAAPLRRARRDDLRSRRPRRARRAGRRRPHRRRHRYAHPRHRHAGPDLPRHCGDGAERHRHARRLRLRRAGGLRRLRLRAGPGQCARSSPEPRAG